MPFPIGGTLEPSSDENMIRIAKCDAFSVVCESIQ